MSRHRRVLGMQEARAQDAAPAVAEPPAPPAERASRSLRWSDYPRSADIRTMPLDDLKVYAKRVGVPTKDIEGLSEDRLRQNAMLATTAFLESIAET